MKKVLIVLFLLFTSATFLQAQDIIIDQPVRAGELTLFPSLRNANEYYYVSDKPRLAKDERGRPQFSFLRYVDNKSSAPGEEDITEGEGGGIVHAVVELDVTEDQLSEASQELKRINPNGKIRGAAMYEGGKFALISTVSDPEAGFSKMVLGLGTAPILDGQKAAVSIFLTKLGAKVLWESFQTSTPDMSFSFEMELKGYKSPKGAVIEADFEQIYEHEAFSAAAISRQGGTMLAGQINTSFEDLYKKGAIKVTSVEPDADIQKAIDDAYSKLTKMMFEQSGGAGTQGTPTLPGTTQPSMLDRAQKLLDEGRKDAVEDFILLARQEQQASQQNTGNNQSSGEGNQSSGQQADQQSNQQGQQGQQSSGGRRGLHSGLNSRPANPNITYQIPRERYAYNPTSPTLPTTAIIASYSMRRVRQRGIFRIDLKKYTTDNVTLRFDQNVGAINCEDCFRQVNIDDPFYRQREIAAILDGYSAQDFQNYINFVAVSFRKKHQNGDYTNGDLRIDRSKFNQQGNFFKFTYGWKGDENRELWNDYEFKTVWNFFGGASVELPWMTSDLNSIGLSPPYVRKVIDVEMEQSVVESEGIRSAEVKVYYSIDGTEMMRQIRLSPRSGILAAQIEILEPSSFVQTESSYEFEVSWILKDGTSKKSDRKSSTSLVIFADQL